MTDKKVLTCDFGDIKPNVIVRDLITGNLGLCLDTIHMPVSLGDGDQERYDPVAIVLIKGRRTPILAEKLEVVEF